MTVSSMARPVSARPPPPIGAVKARLTIPVSIAEIAEGEDELFYCLLGLASCCCSQGHGSRVEQL